MDSLDPGCGSCEHGNTIWVTTKGWKRLERVRNFQLLKEDSTPWRQ